MINIKDKKIIVTGGAGFEISIFDFANKIKNIIGFSGNITTQNRMVNQEDAWM